MVVCRCSFCIYVKIVEKSTVQKDKATGEKGFCIIHHSWCRSSMHCKCGLTTYSQTSVWLLGRSDIQYTNGRMHAYMVWDAVCGCHCTLCHCIWWVCSTFCMYICLIEYTVLASVCVSHGRVGSWRIVTAHIQPSTVCNCIAASLVVLCDAVAVLPTH